MMVLNSAIIFTAALSIIIRSALGDTPANCTYDDVQGTWTFYESARGHPSNIDCKVINDLSHQSQVELVFPNVAIDQYGNRGTWTVVYNQGFELTINNRRYFAFSNWTEIERDKVISRCSETKPGWSHDIYVRDWSCFVGVKQGNPITKVHRDYVRLDSQNETFRSTRFQLNDNLIAKINTMQSAWQAGAYPELQRYTHLEMIRRLGGIKSRVHQRPKLAPVSSRFRAMAQILPEFYDWRNVSGTNFVSPVRQQGDCGSCYAFASLAMLEARYRIMTNNTEQLLFSPQDVIECNKYSQGCDGGFSYLTAGKYAEDFGVVLETCNPYKKNQPQQQTCSTAINCRRYYSTGYRYVGGYYGANNEPVMRQALINNGPLAVAFEVYEDFMHYKRGVYRRTVATDQITSHTGLVVGYGTDQKTGTRYWIVKNSWGSGWGEQGYFRIDRGTDECGIESLAMEATPIPTY